jgi:tRNA dimethylallyltransferase
VHRKSSPTVPLLGAPTASGKSAAALELAERFPLEIVTADAMQVYLGMDIGTGKPDAEERARVPHHLLDLVTPAEPFSVADWVEHAEQAIDEVLARGRVPLVVGGTGFYLRALARGLPTVPRADALVQEGLWRELAERGLTELEAELAEVSPADAERAQRNPRRVVRALEVVRRTGRSPSDFPPRPPRFTCSLAVLEPPLDALRPRIEARCEQMFAVGLVAEVERLLERYPTQLTAMQAIGYKEVVRALHGQISLDEARALVLEGTVRYARRQLTWFRRQEADLRLAQLAKDALVPLDGWLRTVCETPGND